MDFAAGLAQSNEQATICHMAESSHSLFFFSVLGARLSLVGLRLLIQNAVIQLLSGTCQQDHICSLN